MMMMRKYNDQDWFPSLFTDIFNDSWTSRWNTKMPALNVIEDKDEYKVEVAAPGMTKEDCHVSLSDDNELTVAFEKKVENSEKSEDNKKYLRRDFSYSQFQQTFTLPDDVDKEQISAAVDNGVLTISLHKKALEADKSQVIKQIEIK